MMLSLILISPMMKEFDVLAAVVVFVHVLPMELREFGVSW
jgi:hypothetical protein